MCVCFACVCFAWHAVCALALSLGLIAQFQPTQHRSCTSACASAYACMQCTIPRADVLTRTVPVCSFAVSGSVPVRVSALLTLRHLLSFPLQDLRSHTHVLVLPFLHVDATWSLRPSISPSLPQRESLLPPLLIPQPVPCHHPANRPMQSAATLSVSPLLPFHVQPISSKNLPLFLPFPPTPHDPTRRFSPLPQPGPLSFQPSFSSSTASW